MVMVDGGRSALETRRYGRGPKAVVRAKAAEILVRIALGRTLGAIATELGLSRSRARSAWAGSAPRTVFPGAGPGMQEPGRLAAPRLVDSARNFDQVWAVKLPEMCPPAAVAPEAVIETSASHSNLPLAVFEPTLRSVVVHVAPGTWPATLR